MQIRCFEHALYVMFKPSSVTLALADRTSRRDIIDVKRPAGTIRVWNDKAFETQPSAIVYAPVFSF